jgi:hypothetical protein
MQGSVRRRTTSRGFHSSNVAVVTALLLTNCTYHADQQRTDARQGDSAAYVLDARSLVDTVGAQPTKLDGSSAGADAPDSAADFVPDALADPSASPEVTPVDTRGTEPGPDVGTGTDVVFRDTVVGVGLDSAANAVVRDGPSDHVIEPGGPVAPTADAPVQDDAGVGPTSLPPSQPPCSGASQLCLDGKCHDPLTDNAHCGACEQPCTNGQVCSNGSCACPTGTSPCGNTCTNTSFDPQNCGGCGQSCDGGLLCSGSSCTDRCVNSTLCGDHCADLNNDRANCGSCNHACPIGYSCDGTGKCALPCGAQEAVCNDHCVDFKHDVSNCGTCGHTCAFANADSYCEDGTCHMGTCQAGYGNPDGIDTNGCECAKTGAEVCDGKDNDCDGLVDYIIDGYGLPKSQCECTQTPVRGTSPYKSECGVQPPCTPPKCSIGSAEGEMGIDYSLQACNIWEQCSFQSVDLNAFDADHGNVGLLEVSLLVSGLESGEKMNGIGLFYGPYPGRKHFAFFSDQELNQGISNGPYTRYFRPTDVTCQPETGLPSTCLSGCPGGKWGAGGHPECVQNYDGTVFWLAAENCQGVKATVQDVRVHHLTGPVCTCQSDADCRDSGRSHCDLTSRVCVAL